MYGIAFLCHMSIKYFICHITCCITVIYHRSLTWRNNRRAMCWMRDMGIATFKIMLPGSIESPFWRQNCSNRNSWCWATNVRTISYARPWSSSRYGSVSFHGTCTSVRCLVIDLTAAHVSCPTGSISWAGSTKPWLPVSGSSIVYEYLIPATPFAQSSDPPVEKERLF